MRQQTLKCTLVGNSNTGKTSLVYSVLPEILPRPSSTTVDVYLIDTVDKSVGLQIADTGGSDENKKYRQLSYPLTQVFIVCFAFDDLQSFNDIHKWLNEVKEYSAHLILLGLKSEQPHAVKTSEVLSLAKRCFNGMHVACSSFNKTNTRAVFQLSIKITE